MDEYRVELRRVTSTRQLCTMVEDNKSKVTTSISTLEFANLHEFSIYTINIIATIPSGYNIALNTNTAEFITLTAGMSTYCSYSY